MALKDLTVPELLSSLNIKVENEDEFTLDTFKESVGSSYVLKDNVLKDEEIKKKITGKAFGSLTTKAVQAFGLTHSEVDGKPMEEIFALATNKYNSQIEDLKKKAGEGNDKKVEQLIREKEELLAKVSVAENGLKEWENKFNTETGQWESKLKTYKLNDKLNKVWGEVENKFIEDYSKNELVKTGFKAKLDSTYLFDLDENDNPIVKLKADNSIVKSKSKVGHFATPDEILLIEAENSGIIKKNNGGNQKITTFANTKPIDGKSKVHPSAIANATKS